MISRIACPPFHHNSRPAQISSQFCSRERIHVNGPDQTRSIIRGHRMPSQQNREAPSAVPFEYVIPKRARESGRAIPTGWSPSGIDLSRVSMEDLRRVLEASRDRFRYM
jgi:hypothetical protein